MIIGFEYAYEIMILSSLGKWTKLVAEILPINMTTVFHLSGLLTFTCHIQYEQPVEPEKGVIIKD